MELQKERRAEGTQIRNQSEASESQDSPERQQSSLFFVKESILVNAEDIRFLRNSYSPMTPQEKLAKLTLECEPLNR